jgi:hypothetical protein
MRLSDMHKRLAALIGSLLLAACAAIGPAPDRAFTIAVLPDTQNYLDYTHQRGEGFPFDAKEMFLQQMRYIADNAESAGGDIAFATALGDMWQHQSLPIDPEHERRGFSRVPNPIFDVHLPVTPKVREFEMPLAREGYALIDGKLPFSVVPGNHDYDAMWTDARFPPAAKFDPRDMSGLGVLHPGGLDNFRAVFGADQPFFEDKSWYVDSHDGGADSAQVFEAGGYRFLHIGLQFDPPDAALEWAAGVIRAHPGLPTIVTTHDYMNKEGERTANPIIDGHRVDPVHNTPHMVWDKLIRRHDQVFLVLCGHQHGQSMRVDDNEGGHKVWQVLADYQDRGQTAIDAGVAPQGGFPVGIGDGWMRLMRFDFGAAVPVMEVRTWSPHYGRSSSELPTYAGWYKPAEHPRLSDEEFLAMDEFRVELADFRTRFGAPR